MALKGNRADARILGGKGAIARERALLIPPLRKSGVPDLRISADLGQARGPWEGGSVRRTETGGGEGRERCSQSQPYGPRRHRFAAPPPSARGRIAAALMLAARMRFVCTEDVHSCISLRFI